MDFLFANVCRDFNENIGSWETSAVTSMRMMFWSNLPFNQNIDAWQQQFLGDRSCSEWFEATDANIFCAVKVQCAGAAGAHAENLAEIVGMTLEDFYTYYAYVNDDCELGGFAEAVPPACWDTSRVTNMDYLFAAVCYNFDENIDSWNTAAVTSMERMFL